MKKIELKVNMNCQKCKTQVMKAVTKLEGIDELTVNAEKGMLTVIGEVDPVCVTNQVRKTGKSAEIITVGPPKKPDPPKPPTTKTELPPCCPQCQVVISYDAYEFGGRTCTIL